MKILTLPLNPLSPCGRGQEPAPACIKQGVRGIFGAKTEYP